MAGKGHEMRRFLTAVSAMVVLLIIALVVYNTIDATLTLDRQRKQAEEKVLGEAQNIANLSLDNITNPPPGRERQDPGVALQYFHPQLVQGYLAGDLTPLYGLITDVFAPLYGLDAVLITVNGEMVAGAFPAEIQADDFPKPVGSEQSSLVETFGPDEGNFVAWFIPMDLPFSQDKPLITAIVDRTEEINRIQDEFEQNKKSLITRQISVGIAAIIISLLLVLVGIRLLVQRYISGPINKLSLMADRIMDGSFEGKVEVEPDSDYASIQSLLQSGQAIITKIDKGMDQDSDV